MVRAKRLSAVLAILIVKGFALKFAPEIAPQLTMDERVCGNNQKPYEAISQKYPDVCAVFCVPDGDCEFRVEKGEFKYLNIRGSGNCKGSGFTELQVPGARLYRSVKFLRTFQDSCKGMTLSKFKKPMVTELKKRVVAEDNVCRPTSVAYEAISPMFPGVCSVFCVPEGECQGEVQKGSFKYLGISGSGNCKHSGYTQVAELGNTTAHTVESLKHIIGPCRGMTLSKFQKPVAPEQKRSVGGPAEVEQKMFFEDRVCGKDQSPYEAISPMYPGVCSVFCVPSGECEGRVQIGQFKYLGISGSGNCKNSGYTQVAELGNVTRETVDWLKTLQGSCKGMTLSKFQKPSSK